MHAWALMSFSLKNLWEEGSISVFSYTDNYFFQKVSASICSLPFNDVFKRR